MLFFDTVEISLYAKIDVFKLMYLIDVFKLPGIFMDTRYLKYLKFLMLRKI